MITNSRHSQPVRLRKAAYVICVVPALAAAFATTAAAGAPTPATQSYDVQQTVTLSDIPKNAGNVRLWVSIPDDDSAQRVLDLAVSSAPSAWQIVRDRDRGCRFLYMEVTKPKVSELSTTVAFSVQRSAISYELDPASARPLAADQRGVFAEELRIDAPHMIVTNAIRKIAEDVCGGETNPVVQATKLLNHVADRADHYSTNANVPKCGVGDAGHCIANGGG